MKTLLNLIPIILLTACASVQIQTDYDPSVDMSTLKTFTIVHKMQPKEDTLTADRIQEAITKTLQTKSFTSVSQKEADFFVVYHLDVKNKTRVDTTYQNVGLYPYHFGGGMMIASNQTVEYDEGQLIIDIMNPTSRKIIWRGMGIDRIKSFKSPQERTEYIHKAVAKILEEFPPKSK